MDRCTDDLDNAFPVNIANTSLEEAKSVIDSAENVTLVCPEGRNCLFYAAQRPDEDEACELARHILEAKLVDPKQTDAYGQTALFYAAREGHTRCLEMFVEEFHFFANHADQADQTALFYSARDGKSHALEVLVRLGADINHVDANGDTAMFYAARDGREDTVKLMVDLGADVTIRNHSRAYASTIARKMGHRRLATFLDSARRRRPVSRPTMQLRSHTTGQAAGAAESNFGRNGTVDTPLADGVDDDESIPTPTATATTSRASRAAARKAAAQASSTAPISSTTGSSSRGARKRGAAREGSGAPSIKKRRETATNTNQRSRRLSAHAGDHEDDCDADNEPLDAETAAQGPEAKSGFGCNTPPHAASSIADEAAPPYQSAKSGCNEHGSVREPGTSSSTAASSTSSSANDASRKDSSEAHPDDDVTFAGPLSLGRCGGKDVGQVAVSPEWERGDATAVTNDAAAAVEVVPIAGAIEQVITAESRSVVTSATHGCEGGGGDAGTDSGTDLAGSTLSSVDAGDGQASGASPAASAPPASRSSSTRKAASSATGRRGGKRQGTGSGGASRRKPATNAKGRKQVGLKSVANLADPAAGYLPGSPLDYVDGAVGSQSTSTFETVTAIGIIPPDGLSGATSSLSPPRLSSASSTCVGGGGIAPLSTESTAIPPTGAGATPTSYQTTRSKYALQYLTPDRIWTYGCPLKIEEFEVTFPTLALWNGDAGLPEISLNNDPYKARWHGLAIETIDHLLSNVDGAWLFAHPVNPQEWGIDDYFKIVKEPMDFSTIRDRLLRGTHYHLIRNFLDDLGLVFYNCILYNSGKSQIGKICAKVQEASNRRLVECGLQELADAEQRQMEASKEVIRMHRTAPAVQMDPMVHGGAAGPYLGPVGIMETGSPFDCLLVPPNPSVSLGGLNPILPPADGLMGDPAASIGDRLLGVPSLGSPIAESSGLEGEPESAARSGGAGSNGILFSAESILGVVEGDGSSNIFATDGSGLADEAEALRDEMAQMAEELQRSHLSAAAETAKPSGLSDREAATTTRPALSNDENEEEAGQTGRSGDSTAEWSCERNGKIGSADSPKEATDGLSEEKLINQVGISRGPASAVPPVPGGYDDLAADVESLLSAPTSACHTPPSSPLSVSIERSRTECSVVEEPISESPVELPFASEARPLSTPGLDLMEDGPAPSDMAIDSVRNLKPQEETMTDTNEVDTRIGPSPALAPMVSVAPYFSKATLPAADVSAVGKGRMKEWSWREADRLSADGIISAVGNSSTPSAQQPMSSLPGAFGSRPKRLVDINTGPAEQESSAPLVRTEAARAVCSGWCTDAENDVMQGSPKLDISSQRADLEAVVCGLKELDVAVAAATEDHEEVQAV